MRRSQAFKLLFALLLAILPFMVNAQPAWALQIRDTIYYSDASKTTEVGEVYSDPCSETFWSWGTTSAFKDVYSSFCVPQQ
jgi:uncharacterized protein DUF6289